MKHKIKTGEKVRVYEGVGTYSAVAIAFTEGTGLKKLIDDRCRSADGVCRTLNVGMAVKTGVIST